MKIGILTNDLDLLSDWEVRVIQKIIKHERLKLDLIIRDGRKAFNKHSILRPGKILFKIQVFIEKKLFRNYIISNKEKLGETLTSINTISIQPQRRGYIDVFRDQDAHDIKKHQLDLILKLGFDIFEGPIEGISKYGIWALIHSENSMYPTDVVGFREIAFRQAAVCVSLEQLTARAGKGKLIDSAFFNRHWSFAITNIRILDASVSLLFKNINKILSEGHPSNTIVRNHKLNYRYPPVWQVVKYIPGFYASLIKELITVNYKLFGTRYECWTLFIGQGDFSTSTLSELKPVTLPKGEFWADPFLFNYENIPYVFFESYSYTSKKGKICCGRIAHNDLADITDVLDLDYHLSFPNIFEEDGEIFLMPETADNKRLEIYRCITFPDKWELYATAFEGEEVYDPVLYTDDNGLRWLFINKRSGVNSTMDNELYIYQVDSLKLNKYKPHAQNPVIIDSRVARNGGAIYKKNGKPYRPSQANMDGIYGRALNINTIDQLTLENYRETRITTVYPDFQKGLIAMHHLHQVNNLFVLDAAYKKK